MSKLQAGKANQHEPPSRVERWDYIRMLKKKSDCKQCSDECTEAKIHVTGTKSFPGVSIRS